MNMGYYLRLSFVALLVLFVLCSSTFCAFADDSDLNTLSLDSDDTTTGSYEVYYNGSYGNYSNSTFESVETYLQKTLTSDSLTGTAIKTIRESTDDVNPMYSYAFRDQYVVSGVGGTKLASAGESISVSITDIKQSAIGINTSGEIKRYGMFDGSSILEYRTLIQDADGVYHKQDGTVKIDYDSSTGSFTLGADINSVEYDVYRVNIWLVYDPVDNFNNNDGDTTCTATQWGWNTIRRGVGFEESLLTIKYDDNTAGLLSSIIGFVKSILEGVTNILGKIGDFMTAVGGWFSDLISKIGEFISSVGEWFNTLFEMLVQLPDLVWGVFEDGFKKIFVPDEEFIEEYKEDFVTLLETRFGAMYQVGDLVTDYFERLDSSATQDTILMPEVTIPLPDDSEFTFGGYDVELIPDGLEWLRNMVELAVNIVCTFFFVNGMKRRFDTLLGGNV